ncbi:MAG: MerR family transcriptional regulator [Christensenellaceae bacterium]|jgi:DNA-binding transcriptional MerR regulator
MTITEVSRLYDLTADTLRYYERIGLIPPVNRKENGIRDYNEADLRWVEFIKCMRNAGIPVEVLIEYIGLEKQGEKTEHARKELLVEQRSLLAARITEMQETLVRLDGKIEGYERSLLLRTRES